MGEFGIIQWLIASIIFFCRPIMEDLQARWVETRLVVTRTDSGRYPGSSMGFSLCQMARLAGREKGLMGNKGRPLKRSAS